MPDYGHDLHFGFFLDPTIGDPAATLALGRMLDQLRFDLIGIQDHPYQARHFDSLTLISFILAQTHRVRVFPDVANLPLRPPLMLAKQAATIDQLSGGRFELGLGAGAFPQGVRAMGGPVRSGGESLDALREAMGVIKTYWSGDSLRIDGKHYQAMGTRPGPQPAHPIAIWLGVTGPRALRLTGALADGWLPSMSYVSPAAAIESNAIIDAAAKEAGREPASIRRIYNVAGDIVSAPAGRWSPEDQNIVGPVEHWVDVLAWLALEIGFSAFVLWGEPEEQRLRTFIEEIAPAVRERVAAARAAQR
jgi:alkanesulfonate monooxygenase SsuD/methylene tetrahydromethanopterin reductase-like flavin-dependent oxidoreductase (luciferase family)